MSGYIYIIYSELFGKDIYKVGYTSNLSNRIKDSCYTTCFHKPCDYKTVWKYNLDSASGITNAELIEKELHKALSKDKKIKNLKRADNRCNEMYQGNLAVLKQSIENNLSENVTITDFAEANHKEIKEIIRTEDVETLLSGAEYIGYVGHETGKKCYTCRRPIKNIYKVRKDNKLYLFGSDCYKKLFEKNVVNVVAETIKSTLKKYDLSDMYNYTEDYGLTSKKEQETESGIIYNAFIKVAEGTKTFKCTCGDDYLLYQLSKMFQSTFIVTKELLVKKLQVRSDRLDKFYDRLKSLKIFKITDTDITLKKQIEQMSFINNFFSDYSLLGTEEPDSYEEKEIKSTDEYKFNNPTQSIKMSEYTKSDGAYNDCFKYNKSILSGCAGSGKTTSLFGFASTDLNIYEPSKLTSYFTERKDVLILAFTGKAVSVISDKFKEIKASRESCDGETKKLFDYLDNMTCTIRTIDSFLINNNRNKSVHYDYVIIDEFSMVKLHQLYNIIKKCPDSNYLLMGDQNQLDPVGGPSLMKEMLLNCSNNTTDDMKYVLARREICLRTANDDLKGLYTKLSKKDICTIESIKKYCLLNKINEESVRFIQMNDLNNMIEKLEYDEMKVVTKTNETKKKILCQIKGSLGKSSNVKEIYMWKKNIYAFPYEIQKVYDMLSIMEKDIENMEPYDEGSTDHDDLLERVKQISKNQLDAVKYYIEGKIKETHDEQNEQTETQNKFPEKYLLFYNGQDLSYKHTVFDIETLKLIKYIVRNCVSSTSANNDALYENSNVTTIHVSQGSGYHTIVVDARNALSYNELYTASTRAKNSIVYIVETAEKSDLKNKLLKEAHKMHCKAVLQNKDRDIDRIILSTKNITDKGWFKELLSKKRLNLTKEEERLMVSHGLKLLP